MKNFIYLFFLAGFLFSQFAISNHKSLHTEDHSEECSFCFLSSQIQSIDLPLEQDFNPPINNKISFNQENFYSFKSFLNPQSRAPPLL